VIAYKGLGDIRQELRDNTVNVSQQVKVRQEILKNSTDIRDRNEY